MAFIKIHRINGSDGEISCLVRTLAEKDSVPGKEAAVENKDFIPIKDQRIVFKAGEVEQTLRIEMPDCEEVNVNGVDGEDIEPE